MGETKQTVFAIIPAAGLGKRFGAQKQFLELAGKPLLIQTLSAFEKTVGIHGVCVVVPESEISSVRKMVADHALRKVSFIVAGGKERQDSVRLGFQTLPVCDVVVVHDGVRPLVTSELIQKMIDAASAFGAAIAALPVKETTKRGDAENFVTDTVDRSSLWSVQTPQAFRYDVFKKAVEKSLQENFLGTDESMLVERAGGKVKMVEGSPYNIKVTLPEDLKIAEMYLRTLCASD
jgi:2-C-methyl-D-erythritol 4-phosphate cytidylyltransferase